MTALPARPMAERSRDNVPGSTAIDRFTRVIGLRSQHSAGLLGVPGRDVRLSWRAESDRADAAQVAYEIASAPKGGALTSHGIVQGAACLGITTGVDVAPRERRAFAVRIATDQGWTGWSEPLVVEAGVAGTDLDARVVGIASDIGGPVPLLRRAFTVEGIPASARLRLTALGLVDAWINGVRVSDALLTPGWTSYQARILIDTVDVTDLLREGENVIVAAVGDGWYRGHFGFAYRKEIYGDRSGVLAQLEITDSSGATTMVVTDESWRGGFGAVRSAGIYEGTVIDQNFDAAGVHEPGFDDSAWVAASVIDTDLSLFEPRSAAPVRVIAERPMTIERKDDRVLLDSGQNVSGWVRLVVRGTAGDMVTVRHAEVLEPSGALHTAALRRAKATDTYTLAADGEHVLEPVFTFHGFRYSDVVTDVEVLSATAIAISSDLAPRATFHSSDASLDQFHSNVVWSQRDNFVSVPTDCPQRDERLGWTGDAQAFAATANTLLDTEAFWTSWLRDLEIDQTDEGGVPSVVPDIIRRQDMLMGGMPTENMGRAGWADAATIVPLAVYESYGSTEVLERQLDSMRRWVAHLRRRAGDGVVLPTEPFQYGDWLDPDAPAARPWEAKVSSDYVANAFYVHSTRLLARAERIVGDPAAADDLDVLASTVASATWGHWGEEAVTTQTGAALALEFDLAPADRRTAIADDLAANVVAAEGRIATGFLGTPLVLFALSRNGHIAEAYRMLLRHDAPSWLYQVDQGATTVWERWDAIKPDGSIHGGDMDAGNSGGDSGGMLSFNHYAYGAMIDWVYRNVAGLAPDPDDPGYRTVHVAPRPAVGIDHASATIATGLGELAIDWRLEGDALEVALTVPFGARAVLDLPVTAGSVVTVDGAATAGDLGHGVHHLTVMQPAVAGR